MSAVRLTWLYKVLLWIIALSLIIYHGLIAFFTWWPVSYWIEYTTVTPVKESFKINEPLRFRTHIVKNKDVIVTFSDVLFCENEIGDYERYSDQHVERLHIPANSELYAVWPYSPGVAYVTNCCLRSSGTLHLPMDIDREFTYDGCFNKVTLNIVERKDE